MYTVEFEDIRIRAALPLHTYLSKHPHLFLRLVVDGSVCGDTAGVDGDVASGIWEFNARLYAPRVEQSLNVAVLTGIKGPGTHVVSVTLKVAELLERLKACQNRHQYIVIFDSRAAIQLKLVMTCSIKLSSILDRVSKPVGDNGHATNRPSRNNQSDVEPAKLDLSSREGPETLYKKTARTPDGAESKAHVLSKLGHAYHMLYHEEHGKANLKKAIYIHEEAMQCTGLFHPHLAEHAHRFAMALFEGSQQSGDGIDIERAISYSHIALRFTEELDTAKPFRLSQLGNALMLRYQRFGHLVDLENSIIYQREAIGGMPDGDPEKPGRFNNLGIALLSRFLRIGGLTDLEGAISNLRHAVPLMPDSHHSKPGLFSNLGVALRSRFERLGDLVDLEDAISNLRQAVPLTPNSHPIKPSLSTSLGLALQSRFERLGVLADMKDSIANLQHAVHLTPDGHSDKPAQIANLGLALTAISKSFDAFCGVVRIRKRLGGLADLEGAISNLRQAVQLTPDGHPDRPSRFNGLGLVLRSRFLRLGGLTDLEDAISNLRRAVQLTPDGHPDKHIRFNCLGMALRSCFERLGVLTDLEDAISSFRQAVQLSPDGHPDRQHQFNNLGVTLSVRFQSLGVLADLEDALSNLRQAIHLTPDGHPDQPIQFSNLGLALHYRFERLGGLTDLADAVSNHQQAVQRAPDGHPKKPRQLDYLGGALLSGFERLGGLKYLEDAISNLRQAVQLTPDGHPDKPLRINNLGVALRSRFERLGIHTDLEDAISDLRQAVQLIPDGHPDTPTVLLTLGVQLGNRFRCLGNPSDLESAISILSTAANSMVGSAMVRFNAARAWAKAAKERSISPLDAFDCAINLLPRIAWLGLAVTDQHTLLANVGDIVRDAVAAAIMYREYGTAVVWAEQGRSIVWQNLLGLRSPVEDLRETHPELAGRLRSISKQLEGSGSHLGVLTASDGDVSVNYSKLAIEWDDIVEEVRRIPRFEGFLKAKSFRQLAPAAYEGPVVILNVNDVQCDALVLISDESVERKVSVVHIPLERFSYEKSKKMFQTLTELLSSAGVRGGGDRKTGRVQSQVDGEAKFKVILGMLWKDVVKPVIEGLAFQIERKRPPRIWWCATGLLAFLPIHAAGQYDTPEVGEKISDYVISSYTPTLTAILTPSNPAVQDDFQVLTVAQASAPGAPPIPKTEEEVQIIHGLTAGVRRVNLMGKDATVERVQKEMTQSNWIHLACHGKQNSDNPMESGFLLHDRMLKLSEIVKMSLPKADFAFLSACQTAMGDEKLAEESVHLAAGMFLSGCRGVIATTWSIRDDDGPKIAREVYSRMFKDGKPNRKEAAYALNEAAKRLRDSGANCTSWVPFIHIGR